MCRLLWQGPPELSRRTAGIRAVESLWGGRKNQEELLSARKGEESGFCAGLKLGLSSVACIVLGQSRPKTAMHFSKG